ncbi:hypothetical protein ACIA8K_37805 [Catenuloplanes sp. NPDC051500]|uniref:hypothetical protein n=1 Tax=Catenuloplanes sp. NPDC051500 TaxID=3363959 RepID=UPI0037BD3915
MTARTLALTLSTGMALAVMAGCSSSPAPEAAPAPAATSPAAASEATSAAAAPPATGAPAGSSAGDSVAVDGRTISGVAPGLEFPPGATVKDAFIGGTTSTVILSAPSPAEVLDYYRAAAPKAGYTVLTDIGSLLTLQHPNGWDVTVIGQSNDVTLNFNAP